MFLFRLGVSSAMVFALTLSAYAEGSLQGSQKSVVPPVQVVQFPGNAKTVSNSVSQKKVNINAASLQELMQVKGISKTKARNILSYRKKHGNFTSLSDLQKVSGFKKMHEQKFKDILLSLTIV